MSLDVKLFESGHARGVVPTRYGEILLRHARLALSELDHGTMKACWHSNQGLSGELPPWAWSRTPAPA